MGLDTQSQNHILPTTENDSAELYTMFGRLSFLGFRR